MAATAFVGLLAATGCRSSMHVPLPMTPERVATVSDAVESHQVTLRTRSGYRCRAGRVEVDGDSVRWTGPGETGPGVPWAEVAAIETRETSRGAGQGVLVGLAAVVGAWVYARLGVSYEAYYIALVSPVVAIPLGVVFGAARGHRTTIEVGEAAAAPPSQARPPATRLCPLRDVVRSSSVDREDRPPRLSAPAPHASRSPPTAARTAHRRR